MELDEVVDLILMPADRNRAWWSETDSIVDDGGGGVVDDPNAKALLDWITTVLGTNEIGEWRRIHDARRDGLPPEFTRWMWGKLNALLCEKRNAESLTDDVHDRLRAIDEELHEEDLRLLNADPKMRHAFESLMEDGVKNLLHSLTPSNDDE